GVVTRIRLARQLEMQALVSGDSGADKIAPWKLSVHGSVYVSGPIDLADDRFVPVPLQEANLVTCVPRDPPLWRLASPVETERQPDDLPLADAAIVDCDLLMSGDQDSDEAAQHISQHLTGAHLWAQSRPPP